MMNYFVALAYFMKIGNATLEKGVVSMGSVEKFYLASETKLREILGEKLALEFTAFRNSFNWEDRVKELRRLKITALARDDARFPETLKTIPDPPLCLFVKGRIECLSTELIIGIVGTRKVSSYGRQVTSFFSSQLAKNGVVVVSGMALGVDTQAHLGCIEGGGKTIAVLGCGVDIIYPTVNRLLYQRILDTGGAIVSELPPSCMPKPFTFVLRNRIISGLSRGVMVVEGGLGSGSMITANYSIEQGKDVFAVPMPIMSPLSAGPNSLLKQGAKLVLDPQDILSEYGYAKEEQLHSITNALSREERLIYDSLSMESSAASMLSHTTRIEINKLLSLLSIMEIKGLLKKNREGKYEVVIFDQSALGV